MVYDLIIIGAGPAGLTAAIYAARKKMNAIVISKDIGGQAAMSADVRNFIGFPFISGAELMQKFEEQAKSYGIKIKEGEEAVELKKENQHFSVKTNKAKYSAKTVIIASGKVPRLLSVPGEKEFRNKGLTYCATCDAPVFEGKTVAVIGGANAALDATLQLMKIAKKIFLITINDELFGDAIMIEKAKKSPKVQILTRASTKELFGKKLVEGIKVEVKGKTQTLKVQGVFVEIGSLPSVSFAKGIKKDKWGEILIDKKNQTSIKGIFAAGDVTEVLEKQIIIAAAEGAKAAMSAFEFISKTKYSGY